jgi:leucyl/phenylalanyl-tRNA--protein transferase
MLPWLRSADPFPPTTTALTEPNGLLAAGADLSPARLIDAYRRGIFPWFSREQPILWWSPDPRMVLFPPALKISRSLRKTLARHQYEIRVDTCFEQVMRGCAAPRADQDGTWINEAMVEAYRALHQKGYAHSVETWIDGVLVGGLYGIALGRMFYGESMFARVADASKIALVHLVWQLARWQFGMIDCQVRTEHLASLGAQEVPRADFLQRLAELVNYPDLANPWLFDDDLGNELIE